MNLVDIGNQLLDLGKRNRLLNYKETGLKSIDILNKNYKEIYLNLTAGKEIAFLQVDSLIERYHKTFSTNEEESVLEYSKFKVYDITKEAIKQNQIVAYKKGYKLDKVLKNLLKEYNFSIKEKGINSIFVTFGFVNYEEDNQTYRAPLLLIPVDLIRNLNGTFKIQAADDDIILNPTLDYYFNVNRHFDLPDYSSEDFDFDMYMDSIKKVLPKNITFEDGMSIGVYSFLKMNMYKDLVDHKKNVLDNKNIQALLNNPSKDDYALDGDVLPVVNCDSSQLNAIKMAVSGKSFVLQGPPGSGKSQTITNIIASLIGNGRHVLFVSEKLQALQVVYENLKRAGLDEFAIEIHSSKANKKNFIDELYRTATLPKYNMSYMAQTIKDSHEATIKVIEDYKDAIHQLAFNEAFTVYDLYCMYLEQKGEDVSYLIPDIDSHRLAELLDLSKYLKEYRTNMNGIAYDYRKACYYGFINLDTAYIQYEFNDEFTKALAYIKYLTEYIDTVSKYITIDGKEIVSVFDLYKVFDFIPIYNKLEYPFVLDLSVEDKKVCIEKMEAYLSLKTNQKEFSYYDKEILDEDLKSLYRTIKSYSGLFKGLNNDYKEARRIVLSYRNGKTNDLEQELEVLIQVKENLLLRKKLRNEIAKYIPSIDNNNMKAILTELKETLDYSNIKMKDTKDKVINPLLDTLLAFKLHQDNDIYYSKLQTRFDTKIIDFYNLPLSTISDTLNEIYRVKDKLNVYLKANDAVKKLSKMGLKDFLDYYLDNNYPLENLEDSYNKTVLKNKVISEINRNPVLKGFSSTLFTDNVNSFIDLDEKLLQLNRDYIIMLNSKKRPDDVLLDGSKFKILAKEANKVRKQKPIRMLLGEIYDLALDIKPVFLMSPLSVSTYLTENNRFDCVIFDEASQIFASDAFLSIYRANQCIIIGDSKQMPPSNFFGASMDNDEDDYDDVSSESILDMASTSMPSLSLKWHYRSRSESLIAFSNKEFYESTLITIPEARNKEKGFGIDYEYLPNGRYEMKTRTNYEEAKRISEMVIEHYQNSTKSLGVVAFSKVQADLISDLVDEKLVNHPELAKFFSDEVDEPFFVKNLETVQGDERDRIIFSICYGYNQDDKFYQRFGPLNNLGGERRLNVAVTRAKYNVTVVASIMPSDIKDSDSLGVKLLKQYLEFAYDTNSLANKSDECNGVILKLKEFLEDKGYSVYPNYGSSKFKIDLAVKENDHFVLAIRVDGNDKLGNITDSNRLEKLLLERQGWKYYKVYSTSYVLDPRQEEQRLMDYLNDLLVTDKEVGSDVSFIEEKEESLEDHFVKYEAVDDVLLNNTYLEEGLMSAMKLVMEKEAPITKEYYIKRASVAMGKTRVSNVVRNEAAKSMPEDITTIGDTYWLDVHDVRLRINSERMIDEIPMEELKDGIFTIVSLNNGITEEGAFKALIKLLGFSKLTENTKKILKDAIVYLKLDGKIIQQEECLYI